jgi:diguanylate cyclase (GGDEF)-like protein
MPLDVRSKYRARLSLAAACLLVAVAVRAEPPGAVAECEQRVYGAPSQAVELADAMLAGLDETAQPEAWHEALGCKAWALAMLGESAKALDHAERMAAAAARFSDSEATVRVLRRAASVQQTLGRGDQAIELLGRALGLARDHGFVALRIEVGTNLAVEHASARQFDLAISHLEEALALAQDSGDRRRELAVRFNLGQVYRDARRPAEAADMLVPLVPALEVPGMEARLASILSSLAWLRLELGEIAEAESLFRRAGTLHETLDNPAERTVVLNGLATIALNRGDAAAARTLADQALALARQADDHPALTSALQTVERAAEAQGLHHEALAHLRERMVRVEQHLLGQQRSRLNELEVQLGLERQARELDQLRRERERQIVALDRQRLIIMVVIVAVVAVLLGLLWQRGVARRMRLLSHTDPLTGLANRRALAESATRRSECLVLLVDVDRFKAINDRHGHEVGDRVLVAVAGLLARFAEARGGEVGRWGGEEFLLLLPQVAQDGAISCLEALGAAVAALRVPVRDHVPLPVSVSAGFAPLGAVAGDDARSRWEEALRIADAMLYRAKREGRNRAAGAWPADDAVALAARRLDDQFAAGEARLLDVAFPAADDGEPA